MDSFSVTYDYRCPFARIAHLHLIEALEGGASFDVSFSPFSLGQAHVPEGGTPVWDDPTSDTGLLALQVSVVVRERHPESFLQVHRDLFDLRHVHAGDLKDPDQIASVLASAGLDAAAVMAEVSDGWPLDMVRKEHEFSVQELDVWGVPTFMTDDEAVFVRLMEAPEGDSSLATRTIERIVDMLHGWPALNEYKHTSLRR
ncbi:MAG: DsbA family protein [Acidimicrobiales bacterium]